MSPTEHPHERRSCSLCHLDEKTIRWLLAVGRLEPATIRWLLGGVACILMITAGIYGMSYDVKKQQEFLQERQAIVDRSMEEQRRDVDRIRASGEATSKEVAGLTTAVKYMTESLNRLENVVKDLSDKRGKNERP